MTAEKVLQVLVKQIHNLKYIYIHMYIYNEIQFKKHAFTSLYIKSALFLWKVYKYIDNME